MSNETPNKKQKKGGIDFKLILQILLKHKKTFYKVLPVTFVIACFIALSIPKYYKCEVLLAPELASVASRSSLSALASSFGFNVGNLAAGTDAVNPMLYPDLINSIDFKISLFPVKVQCDPKEDEEIREFTYFDYLDKEQKKPWWSSAIGSTIGAIADLIPQKKGEDEGKIDAFRLTKRQTQIVKALDKKIVCDIDKRTMVITIEVTDQDPLICATMADTVKNRLQAYITDYRTKKARVDYNYYQKLYKEAKERYHAARQKYAVFADANQEVYLETVRQKMSELENEMQLQYNIYQQVVAQRQNAEAKVQEETPAFTTLQNATVPVKKAGPGRMKIVLFILFLAFAATSARILHQEGQLKPLLGLS